MDKIAFSSFACIFSKPNTILYAYLDTVTIKGKGVEMSHSQRILKDGFSGAFQYLTYPVLERILDFHSVSEHSINQST